MLPIILSLPILFASISDAYLVPRDSTPVCTDLRANSNDGDRKIAIVIDSSGSMAYSDPYGYRLTAGKLAIDWLISKSEATGTQKPDEVTVINFDDQAYLDYPLGDPGAAASALTNIGADGGTYIAGGVEMAIEQLTAAGTGETSGRSGILVFTDGEDSSTSVLVDQINRATQLDIRVAFGFLDDSSSLQDPDVLSAIMSSGGRYFTIQNYNASKAFIDGIIVNGLTKNDNPEGDTTTLFAGLDASHFISGSETQTMTYSARSKEQLTFDVESVNAGTLSVQVVSGGKTLAKGESSYYSTPLSVIAPSTEKIDVKVTASNANKDSIFVVGVTSNLPPQNCTVGVGPPPKSNNVPKIVGGAIGGVFALLFLGGFAYLIYKHCHSSHHNSHTHSTGGPPSDCQGGPTPNPSSVPWFKFLAHPPSKHLPPKKMRTGDEEKPRPNDDDHHERTKDDDHRDRTKGDDHRHMDEYSGSEISANENDPNQPDNHHTHMHRLRIRTYGNNHHHHIPPEHPCYNKKCPIASHVCEDPRYPCTCVDPKCKLNSRRHKCRDENMPHTCVGPDSDPRCPLNDPEYAKMKEAERDELVRKYMTQDMAMNAVKMTATTALQTAL